MARRNIADLLQRVQDAYLELGEPVTEARLERMIEAVQNEPTDLIALNNAVGESVKVEIQSDVAVSPTRSQD